MAGRRASPMPYGSDRSWPWSTSRWRATTESDLDALLERGPLPRPDRPPGGERCKSQAQLDALLDAFEAYELPKHGVVMAVGGGTVSDVAGLAAMLIRRAVPLVLLPTTLLAQVDAAVGGKNGINSATTKNVIGHFHHPLVVASDPRLFKTLDQRNWRPGIAECIKVFGVADPTRWPATVPPCCTGLGRGPNGAGSSPRRSTTSSACWPTIPTRSPRDGC